MKAYSLGSHVGSEVERYIRATRNPIKKQYANAYAMFQMAGRGEPEIPTGISYMASQAVRLRIIAIINSYVEGE